MAVLAAGAAAMLLGLPAPMLGPESRFLQGLILIGVAVGTMAVRWKQKGRSIDPAEAMMAIGLAIVAASKASTSDGGRWTATISDIGFAIVVIGAGAAAIANRREQRARKEGRA